MQGVIGKIPLAILAVVLGACQSTETASSNGSSSSARGVSFSVNCKMPAGSMKRIGSGYEFTLKDGDVGGCDTDAKARHSAPYWERAEVRSAFLRTGAEYEITFDVKFDPSTRSSNRTSFFQIHTYNDGCKSCGPALMLKAHGNGQLGASVLSTPTRHTEHGLGVSRAAISSDWASIQVVATTNPGQKNRLEVYVNGRQVLATNGMLIPEGGKPHLKIGLYRPGSSSGLPTDRVSIRNVRSKML